MAHNIGYTSSGKRALVFTGDRKDIWHHLGQQAKIDWTIEQWAAEAGLNWDAIKAPAFVDLTGCGIGDKEAIQRVDNRHFVVRNDNGFVLSKGTVTDGYHIVQPKAVLDFCHEYVAVDDRFALDTAMCLKNGEIIAVTAVFNGDSDIAGSAHRARLLMTTTFDGSVATKCAATMTRVVCNNTLDAALASKGTSTVSIRHNTRFNPDLARKQLEQVASGFAAYKVMAEAMASHRMPQDQVGKFFKAVLDIPFDSKPEDISTRKMNQFSDLSRAYSQGVRNEGLEPLTAWSALNAVTRYVDHDRSVRNGGSPRSVQLARFTSAQFGSGATMKAHAVEVLDEMSSGDLLRAVAAKTSDQSDVSAMLKQSFRSSFDA